MRTFLFLILLIVVTCQAGATSPAFGFVEQVPKLLQRQGGSPMKLKGSDVAVTRASFKPPVEILIEAKTNSTNLRLSYAADQVIFNWEVRKAELRVDGGPANGRHKMGAGLIRPNKYVLIRWVVLPSKQMIYVDGELRFEHEGNYSRINNPIGIFPSHGAEVTVRSIKVRSF